MRETRVLRERKKVIYNEDAVQIHETKAAEQASERRVPRSKPPAKQTDKENRKRRERPERRQQIDPDNGGSSGSDSDDDVAVVRPPAKRAKSPPRVNDGGDDAIKGSEKGDNAFVAFVRPGKVPPTREAAPAATRRGRPPRAAATRAAAATRRMSAAAAGSDDGDDDDGDGKAGRRHTTRTAAVKAKERLRRGAAAASGGGQSSSSSEDGMDESRDDSGGEGKVRKAGGSDDVEMTSSSESDSGNEEADEEPVVEETRKGRPSRGCVARTAVRAAATNNTKDRRRRQSSESKSSSDSSSDSDSESDDSEDEAEEDVRGGAAARAVPGKRAPATARVAGGGSADSADSEMQLADGDDDQEDTSGDEASDDEDVPKGKKRSGWLKGKTAAKAGGGGSCDGASKPKEPVQRILSYDADKDLYRVKLQGVSYRRTVLVKTSFLNATKVSLLRQFRGRDKGITIEPEWLLVDRVIDSRTVSRGSQGSSLQLLIKWKDLEYVESTWEYEEDLTTEADKAAIARFHRHNAPPAATNQQLGGVEGLSSPRALRQPGFELPTFLNGRKLRDYQQVSVRWMVNNYCQRRNCILGDEMGLGKTAQSISALETLRTLGGVKGPFIIVAPLTTLGHWQREIETWTDMNVVLYAGAAADRAMIVKHEFYRGGAKGGGTRRNVKFNVLLTSYDTLRAERLVLRSIYWSAAVFDEAHRLKGVNSSTRAVVNEMSIDWLLLLTGTPVQNNMMELYSIMSLLDPVSYSTPEAFTARFGGDVGGPPPNVEQIKNLKSALAPLLLRRMKEDVEDLPQKEEVVIWVELTAHQRAYYRSMYEGQIGALLGSVSKNLPSLRNLAMELRKLCCHPVLCDGLEDDLKFKLAQQRSVAPAGAPSEFNGPEMELLVRGSGKMLLLHKLLPKLKAEGRRVLIFSQFVIMLNVLEDYCTEAGYPVERIDGSVSGRERQQAIDRFSAPDATDDTAFVFLLSTKAGGQGITLTAADTCIIYDSDWNPQNDLQAMARCHRIGQKKEVTVYRLISRDTYEMSLFSTASRKYGLDEAILGISEDTDPEADSARIADLLRNGAHGLLSDIEGGVRQGDAFASEDINQILEARTEKRQIGSRAGNTFSVATFVVDDADGEDPGGPLGRPGQGRGRQPRGRVGRREEDDRMDKDYWRALMPEAVAAHEARGAEGPLVLGPRKRNKVNYNMADKRYNPKVASSGSSSSDSSEGEEQPRASNEPRSGSEPGSVGEPGAAAGEGIDAGKKRRRSQQQQPRQQQQQVPGGEGQGAGVAGGKPRGRRPGTIWTKAEIKTLEDRLVGMGPDRWDEVYAQLQPIWRTAAEVEEVGRRVWELYGFASSLALARKKKKVADASAARTAAVRAAREADARRFADIINGVTPSAAPVDGGGGAAPAAAGPGINMKVVVAPDEYECQLLDELAKLPETIRTALNDYSVARRMMRCATEEVRHAKCMVELAAIVRSKKPQQPGASAIEGAGGSPHTINGLKVGHVVMPYSAVLPTWWSREHDEVLLISMVQVGYTLGYPRRTVEHALRTPPLSDKLVLQQTDEWGDDAEAADAPMEAAAVSGRAVAAAAACSGEGDDADGDGDHPMVEAGVPAAGAPASAAAPAGPQRVSPVEWRLLVQQLGRRLGKIISSTLDLHNRLNNTARPPLCLAQVPGSSAPLQPPSRDMPPAAAGRPPQPAAALPPPAAAAAAGPSVPQAFALAAAVAAALQKCPASVLPLLASTKPPTQGPSPTMAPAVGSSRPVAAAAAQPAAASGTAHGQQEQPRSQAQQPAQVPGTAADAQPQKEKRKKKKKKQEGAPAATAATVVGCGQAHAQTQQQERAAPAAAAPAAAAPAAATGSKSNALKQRTLPFSRLGSTGPQKTTKAAQDGNGGGAQPQSVSGRVAGALSPKAASKSAAVATKVEIVKLAAGAKTPAHAAAMAKGKVGNEPGSVERPIEVDDSD